MVTEYWTHMDGHSLLYLQVGKGLSKDEKAQKLALQHWLEAVWLKHYPTLSSNAIRQ
jgi:hypothetical protein